MSRALRELSQVRSRVLVALRFVDAATGGDVESPLRVRALDGRARLVRNASGLQVLTRWSLLPGHDVLDDPPQIPADERPSLRLAIEDPSGRYLPRLLGLVLPRAAVPAEEPDSLFAPVQVPMFLAASAATGANWAVLRVSLREASSGDALGGALLRVRRNGQVLARGMTDWRGEALLAVVGVPVMTFGEDEDAVLADALNVTVEAIHDPASGSRVAAAALDRAAAPPPGWPQVDPQRLEQRAGELPATTRAIPIAARRSHRLAMTLALP